MRSSEDNMFIQTNKLVYKLSGKVQNHIMATDYHFKPKDN